MSNELKHIAGPWLIAEDGRFVYALNERGVNSFCANVSDAHTPVDQLKATARLIAAAPDLLEALGGALDQLIGPSYVRALEAIAKATGATP